MAASDTLKQLLDRDFGAIAKTLQDFISNYVSASGAAGVTVGLSGGLDSSVLVKLCVNALGPSRVFGLVLPSRATPKADVDDAISLAESIGVKHETVDISPIIESFMQVLPDDNDNKKAKGNLTARIRMCAIYHHAFVKKMLVGGTSDKSELYIGYFTKYGDGGADIIPIADLYKTQVRKLGREIGVPSAIIEKKSSPRLWDNHLAEEEIGLEYEVVDPILHYLVDRQAPVQEAAKELALPLASVQRIRSMMDASAHKRAMAKIAFVT